MTSELEITKKNEVNKIPKIIHYIWVGEKPLTPLAEHCLKSWKENLPDYEIRFWNEANSPMDHHYVQAMYDKKKWAFVSDYIRFWALEKEGGIYLDTDMEILKPLDSFLDDKGFVGVSKSGNIESSIIGSVPHADFIQNALKFYDQDTEYTIDNTSPIVIKKSMEDVFGVKIYDYSYFHPCDEGEVCSQQVLSQAYGRHHWAESWVPFAGLRKVMRKLKIMKLLKRFYGNE